MLTEDDASKEQSQFKADEDWKQRVKAEDAALDQKLKEDGTGKPPEQAARRPGPKASDASTGGGPLPPADFAGMVGMFSTQAMVAFGVIPSPVTGKADPQMELARHMIDMLGVLEEKTRGNLDPRESSLLQTSLHQLRVAFVEIEKQLQRPGE